jgi:putative transposase
MEGWGSAGSLHPSLTNFADVWSMSSYRRPKHAGATIFFTINLANRGSDLLMCGVEALRAAVAQTQAARPCVINARVILRDYMHCI